VNQISLTLNGKSVQSAVEPRTNLADFLRDGRDLTGTHLGCEHGVCGACTIVVDGMPVRSCITLATACDGADVATIEAFDHDEIMVELRDAFKREHALQCGYCTPGMLISARDIVIRSPDADEKAIRIAMSGNLCRCTGYVGIIRAIRSVIIDRRARNISPISGAGRSALGPAGSGHVVSERLASSSRDRLSVERSPKIGGPAAAVIDRDWVPQMSFDQSFRVGHPRPQVWAMFGRVAEVAACLPGASLSGDPTAERVVGQIRVKVGPISAEFSGAAEIERDDASYSGRIIGAGNDARSKSTTRGAVTYRLLDDDEGRATVVQVTVGYALSGMLAQFGRAGIVKDVAGRLTESFAKNLEARLSGHTQNVESSGPGLDAGSLVVSILAEKLKATLKRITSLFK
jgi:aerobic carbon-monoxide dehydrogenase small subunit